MPSYLSNLIRILPIFVLLSAGLIWLAQQHMQQRLLEQAHQAQQQQLKYSAATLSRELKQLQRISQRLANNALLINSLIDLASHQRLAQSLLESVQLPGPIPAHISILDYRGRPFPGFSHDTQYNHAGINSVLQGHALTQVSEQGLVIAQPIYIGAFVEAALFIEYPADAFKAWMNNLNLGQVALINNKNDVLINLLRPVDKIDHVFVSEPRLDRLIGSADIRDFNHLKLVNVQTPKSLKHNLDAIEKLLISYLLLSFGLCISFIGVTAWLQGKPLQQLVKLLSEYQTTLHLNKQLATANNQDVGKIMQSLLHLDKMLMQQNTLGITDEETQLANQHAFEMVLEREFFSVKRQQASLSLALIELDHIEALKQQHKIDHQQLVEYLKQVGQYLKSQCRRQHQDLVARFGPYGFALILPNTSHPEQFAEQLRRQLEHFSPVPDPVNLKRMTISIGLANVFPHKNEQNSQQLFKSAQIGLYRAKKRGGNQVSCISVNLIKA